MKHGTLLARGFYTVGSKMTLLLWTHVPRSGTPFPSRGSMPSTPFYVTTHKINKLLIKLHNKTFDQLKWVRLNRLPCAVIAISPGLDKTNSPSATAQTSLHLRVPNICSLSDWLNCSVGGSWRCNTGVHRSRRFPLCCLRLRVIIVFVA